jgi:hypothetical protein
MSIRYSGGRRASAPGLIRNTNAFTPPAAVAAKSYNVLKPSLNISPDLR